MTKCYFQKCLFQLNLGLYSHVCTRLRCEVFFLPWGDVREAWKHWNRLALGLKPMTPWNGPHSHAVTRHPSTQCVAGKKGVERPVQLPPTAWASSSPRKGLSRDSTPCWPRPRRGASSEPVGQMVRHNIVEISVATASHRLLTRQSLPFSPAVSLLPQRARRREKSSGYFWNGLRPKKKAPLHFSSCSLKSQSTSPSLKK